MANPKSESPLVALDTIAPAPLPNGEHPLITAEKAANASGLPVRVHVDARGVVHTGQAPGEAAKDFVIQGPLEHGVPGLVNLFGIESPGLTSSLAIGDYVSRML